MTRWDIAIIGGGVAGAFAAMNIASHNSKMKTILFEYGPPPPNCLRQESFKYEAKAKTIRRLVWLFSNWGWQTLF